MLRVLHTSDWHAGKTLFKHDRLPDLSYALEQMEALIDHKAVDVMVIAGDLYDTFHPPSPAIEVLNQFFLALHHRQIPVVMISGNHDSTRLWKSMRDILQLASVHVFDRLQRDAHHVLDIKGERLCITGLPYPSERQLVRLSDTHETLASQRQHYADKVAGVMRLLTASRPDADYHMLCAHLMLSGAEPGHSERALSIADTFAIQPQSLPDSYDYIALGIFTSANRSNKPRCPPGIAAPLTRLILVKPGPKKAFIWWILKPIKVRWCTLSPLNFCTRWP